MRLWIARRVDFNLELHSEKPSLEFVSGLGYIWKSNDFIGFIDKRSFLEITFGNSPQEVELKLVN